MTDQILNDIINVQNNSGRQSIENKKTVDEKTVEMKTNFQQYDGSCDEKFLRQSILMPSTSATTIGPRNTTFLIKTQERCENIPPISISPRSVTDHEISHLKGNKNFLINRAKKIRRYSILIPNTSTICKTKTPSATIDPRNTTFHINKNERYQNIPPNSISPRSVTDHETSHLKSKENFLKNRAKKIRRYSILLPSTSTIRNLNSPSCTIRSRNTTFLINKHRRYDNIPPISISTHSVSGQKTSDIKIREYLPENREERRLRQVKEKIKNKCSSKHPNWEILHMVQNYQKTSKIDQLSDNDAVENPQVNVCVRKRPLTAREIIRNEIDIVTMPTKNSLIIHEPKKKIDLTCYLKNHKFSFDHVFDHNCDNKVVYKYTAQPLVWHIFNAGMATCFAYGQTGSGKTHTMGGSVTETVSVECRTGLYELVVNDIFDILKSPSYSPLNIRVEISYYEIYNSKLYDLLRKKTELKVLENGNQQVQVIGLTKMSVKSLEEVLELLKIGYFARTSGNTDTNDSSSRSHAVVELYLYTSNSKEVYGKLSLVDLAGNERGKDIASANRQIRMESAEINKSLLALKECIRAMSKGNNFIPFRGSKLTQVLKEAFVRPKSKICMINMLCSGNLSCSYSLNTLRYADRVKELVLTDTRDNENKRQLECFKNLQSDEEEIVKHHTNIIAVMSAALPQWKQLNTAANNAEYNEEDYCDKWDKFFTEAINMLSNARDKITDYRRKVIKAEELSKRVKK